MRLNAFLSPIATCLLTLTPIAVANAQVADHLECFKLKDSVRLKGIVDLESDLGVDEGCQIKRARYYCTPASKTVVEASDGRDPLTPLPFSTKPASGDRICYSVKCPKENLPDRFVTDQFGQRTIAKLRAKLVCTPAVAGTEYCGDGVINGTEDCEPDDVGGVTCGDLGFSEGGSLTCTSGCRFDVGGCETVEPCGQGTTLDSETGQCEADIVLSASPTPPQGYILLRPPSWAEVPSMPTARSAAGSTSIGDSIYVVGGGTTPGPVTGALERFSTTTGAWETLTAMPTQRQQAAVEEVDGLLYAIGGAYTAANEVYDPSTNSWSTRQPMPTVRAPGGAASVGQVIYVVGGSTGSNTLDVVEAYDASTNTWTIKAPLPTARSNLAVAAANGKVYVFGGNVSGQAEPSNAVDEYDPLTNTWSSKTPLPTARHFAAAAVLNGLIYVLGGQDEGATWLDIAEVYDPLSNSWSSISSMNEGRYGPTATVLAGRVYAIGGYFDDEPKASVEEYLPLYTHAHLP